MIPRTLTEIDLDASFHSSGPEWTLLAAGDFCSIEPLGQDKTDAASGYVTPELASLISQANAAIVNLEGPIRTGHSPIPKSGPALQLDREAPSALRQAGFDVATLANNHIMDLGPAALRETVQACWSVGLQTCGAGESHEEAMRPLVLEVAGGSRLAILAFCEQEFGIAGQRQPGSAWISHPEAETTVAQARQGADVVVVCAHGGNEETPFPPVQRQTQLRRFIEVGATLVIGHHPHVPQGWEYYQNGLIFYSLGNFLFDYPGGARYPKTEWGLVVRVHFSGTALTKADLIPTETQGGIVGKMGSRRNPEEYLRYLHRLAYLTAEPERLAPYWQETAAWLLKNRYLPWLRSACGAEDTLPSHLRGAVQTLRRRVGLESGRSPSVNKQPSAEQLRLLLNLFRNESHHWAIETALALLSGECSDARTPEIQDEVRHLMEWTTP